MPTAAAVVNGGAAAGLLSGLAFTNDAFLSDAQQLVTLNLAR
jgi:hypothetical protein